MEVAPLVRLIIKKFEEAGGYTEIKGRHFSALLTKHLTQEFKKEINAVAMQLEVEEQLGRLPSQERYHEEYEKAENKIVMIAQELAATCKEDLENLV
ncbi:MAG: hypothetical protein ACTSU6_00940 [Candidatus Njordarchaeales archaeon]